MPERGEGLPTQTVEKPGTDQDTVSTTPMKETVPGPEHKQQDTTDPEGGASGVFVEAKGQVQEPLPNRSPELEHRNGVYVSKRTLVVGAAVTAAAVVAAIFVPKVVADDSSDGQPRQEPSVSAAPFPTSAEQPALSVPPSLETTAPTDALLPLPPGMEKYLDPSVPYTGQVPASETNLDTILTGLLQQRETAINTNRLDILRAVYYSRSDLNPLRELDEDVMKLTKDSGYVFDADWQRAGVVKATVPHPSDPTIGSMEAWKVTVQGTDMHRARKMGDSYPMPREYDMTFYLLPDTAYDAEGNPTGQVWTIAGNYSGADFEAIQAAYAGEIN